MEILPDKIKYEWIMTLFDDEEYVLTEEEYQGFKEACLREVKMIHFDRISVAVSQIKTVVRGVVKEASEPINWEILQ